MMKSNCKPGTKKMANGGMVPKAAKGGKKPMKSAPAANGPINFKKARAMGRGG